MQGRVRGQGQPGSTPEVGPAGGGCQLVGHGGQRGVLLPEVEPVEHVPGQEPAVVDAEQETELVHGPLDQRGGIRGELHGNPEVRVGGPQLEAQALGIEPQEGLSLRLGLREDAQPPGRDRGLPRPPVAGCLDRKPPNG